MPRATPADPRAVLTPRQQVLVRILVGAFLLIAATGAFLLTTDGSSFVAMAALFLHLLAGAICVPILLAFVVPHAVKHLRRKPGIAFTGVLVLFLLLALVYTGVLLTFQRRSLHGAWVYPLHVFGGIGVLVLYMFHRRWGANPAPYGRLVMASVMIAFLGLGLSFADRLVGDKQAAATELYGIDPNELLARTRNDSGSPFGLSLAKTASGQRLSDSRIIRDVARCAECHPRIAEDTRRSAHRHASMTNPFYTGTIKEMRRKYPILDTKWCAGCHDPALLFTGEMDDEGLDFHGENARTGLTCLSCHAIQPQSTLGNGDYVLTAHRVYSWEKSNDPAVIAAHDVLLQANPDAHAKSLTPIGIQQGEFCSTCHKATVPPELNRWHFLVAQNTFDEWHNSGVSLNNAQSFYHPPAAKQCQDCHMPLVADPSDPAADKNGLVKSHLFAAANTALPHLRGDTDMIERIRVFQQNALRIDFTGLLLPAREGEERRRLFAPVYRSPPAVKAGEVVEAHLVVRNKGVGHRFPTGTLDSNEVWVEFEVRVGDGEPFWASGMIDPDTNRVDERAEFFRAWVADKEGKRVVNRIGPDGYTRVYVKQINPGTAQVVRYRFRIPDGQSGPVRMKARLRYRKFMQEYIDFLYPNGEKIEFQDDDGRVTHTDPNSLPIIDVATAQLELPVTEAGTAGPAPELSAAAKPEDREQINDLGIGYLLQRDYESALRVFREVTRMDPSYADGWVNVARAHLMRAQYPAAMKMLDKALELEPGFAKARFFQGEVYRSQALFDQAATAYRDTLKVFAKDRLSLKRLADVLWNRGTELETDGGSGGMARARQHYVESLRVLEKMWAIDPQDWQAWNTAVKVYKSLGDPDKVEAASVALERFRPPEFESTRAGDIQNDHPHLQWLAQPQHVHKQPGVN